MVGFHPRSKRRIEIEIAPKLAEGKIGRLERHHPPARSDELGKMERVRSNIGSDIQHQGSRGDQLAQRALVRRS